MKHMGIIAGVALLIMTLGVLAAYVLTKQTADPGSVFLKRVHVTEEMIVLEDISFTGSAMWYVGHSVSYDEGVLAITLYSRAPIRFPGDQYSGFTIQVPNTYSDIKEVRLTGGTDFADKTIWTAP